MAYVQSPIPQNEQNQFAPTGQTTPNPLAQMPPQGTGGSAGQGGSGGAGTQAAPGVGSSTQFGSNASKLSDYLSANAPQIQSMGNQIAGNLTSQFGQVQGDVNTAAGGFQNAVSGGYTPEDTGLVNQAAANPSQFAQNPQNVTAFQSQLNDAYTGPQNFEGTAPYAQIQGEVNQAAQGAGLLNSPAGLSSYLNTNVEQNATPGENTLDTALLESNQPAYQQVQQAVQPLTTLPTYLSGMTTAADQLVAPAQQAATQASQQANAAFTGPGGIVPTFENSVNTGATNAEQQRQAYNTSLNQFYAQATPFEQQIQQWAGILPGTMGQQVPNLVAPILAADQPVNTPVSATNYSTPDQYSEAAALQQLSGNTLNLPISQATAGQAGTAPSIPNFNPPTLNQLAQQYEPSITKAWSSVINQSPQSAGDNPTIDALMQPTGSLANYLNQYDPTYWENAQGGFGI